MVSLTCLLIVTGYVTASAVHVIYRPSEDHEDVNIYYLYGFSTANVLVDVLSSYMFFREGDEDVFLSYRIQKRISSYTLLTNKDDVEAGGIGMNGKNRSNGSISGVIMGTANSSTDNSTDSSTNFDTVSSASGGKISSISSKANLNMISAFTHLTGDSMRTFSVIVAALISTIAGIPSNICDAWAAIVVTITICFMVIPLVWEINKAIFRTS